MGVNAVLFLTLANGLMLASNIALFIMINKLHSAMLRELTEARELRQAAVVSPLNTKRRYLEDK